MSAISIFVDLLHNYQDNFEITKLSADFILFLVQKSNSIPELLEAGFADTLLKLLAKYSSRYVLSLMPIAKLAIEFFALGINKEK